MPLNHGAGEDTCESPRPQEYQTSQSQRKSTPNIHWKDCCLSCLVQLSCSVSVYLQLHGLHHTTTPCPSPIPESYSNSCPLSQWCHPTILCRPLLLCSIVPSIRVFSNESALHIRWPKYWNFSFNISPSNEYSGLISPRIDWFDLPAVEKTLKSLLQYHRSKTSILQCSALSTVQLSHLYMTTGKTTF